MQSTKKQFSVLQEVVVGLTVSTVALSLGGAFGLLSGRGVLVGMLSAAIFPLVTSIFGGTRIQCSGPTGPMTSVFIALIASTADHVPDALVSGYLNMTIFLAAVLLIAGGAMRLGNWIHVVPNVVISGFMDGIALIIWASQLKKLFHIGSPIIEGSIVINCIVATATLAIACTVTQMTKHVSSRIAALFSGTLIALVVMTILCTVLDVPVGKASADVSLHSWSEFSALFSRNAPHTWPWELLPYALWWALQLAIVAYLDTLLTTLIIDRTQHDTSQKNKELGAQGLATMLIACIGGVPGAQATERSVLMIKEGAQSRLAGILVGIFALLGVLLLQDLVSLIPKAVFAGILLKVGYDVFDWQPLMLYLRQTKKSTTTIHHSAIALSIATAVLTLLTNVIVGVIVCTALFYALQRCTKGCINDYSIETQTEGLVDEP